MPLRIYDSPQVHRRLVFFQQLNALTHDLSENMSVLKAYNESYENHTLHSFQKDTPLFYIFPKNINSIVNFHYG